MGNAVAVELALVVMVGTLGGSAPLVAGAAPAPAAQATIVIKNFEFAPAAVTVAVGGTVRWVNADVANHQVSSGVADGNRLRPDGRVSSPLFFRGEAFAATFPPGTYHYYCGVHPFMRGTVVVR